MNALGSTSGGPVQFAVGHVGACCGAMVCNETLRTKRESALCSAPLAGSLICAHLDTVYVAHARWGLHPRRDIMHYSRYGGKALGCLAAIFTSVKSVVAAEISGFLLASSICRRNACHVRNRIHHDET